MDRIRLILIGGFLGAGKTTVVGRLARDYAARGLRVGLITNDQAADLVDTHNLRAQGFPVEEVAGSCFCCAFDQLAAAFGRLARSDRPDVLLAEPVGSCTDLAATVLEPVRRLYADRYVAMPLVVLVDPRRADKILTRAPRGGFSPRAAYIYEKQLEEADLIAVNKADSIAPAERDRLLELLRTRFPGRPILAISARTGTGIDGLRAWLDDGGGSTTDIPEVDYDVYAQGEAELGWLNASLELSAGQPLDPDGLLLDLLGHVRDRLAAAGAEVAHVKAIARADGTEAVGSLVTLDAAPELSRSSASRSSKLDVILNARVFLDPAELQRIVQECLERACAPRRITIAWRTTRHLRPGRPVPTHRYASRRT